MAEQLQLAQSEAAAPSAWLEVRAANPGKPIARIIDLKKQTQAFVTIGEEGYAFLIDGSTHFVNVPAGGLSRDEHDAVVAEYDIAWRDWRPAA